MASASLVFVTDEKVFLISTWIELLLVALSVFAYLIIFHLIKAMCRKTLNKWISHELLDETGNPIVDNSYGRSDRIY